MKYALTCLAAAALLVAGCDHSPPTSTGDFDPSPVAKPGAPPGLSVASLKQPVSIDLPDGRVLERRVHIFWRKGHGPQHNNAKGGNGGGKPDKPGGGKPGGGTSDCYSYLANGAKWKVTEPYMVDQLGGWEIDGPGLSAAIAQSVSAWNGPAGVTVLGSETVGLVDGADEVSTDGKNEVLFGTIDDPGVIAVTITWGIFGGPPKNRQLVEWDLVFNGPGFVWGDAGPTDEGYLGDTSVMDLLNIAVHEVGHAAGMGHPDGACGDETMYAYAEYGETKKRTLNAGDIAGIQALYR